MRRLTILGVMCGVGMVAVGLAALRDASEVWEGVTFTLTLGILGTAALGAIQRRGRSRAWWVGFGVFGWGYLVLSQCPWLSERVEPRLLTGQALRYVTRLAAGDPKVQSRRAGLDRLRRREEDRLQSMLRLVNSPKDPALVMARTRIDAIGAEIEAIDSEATPESRRWRAMLPGAENESAFVRIGHDLCALAAALIGAAISRGFYVERDRPPDAPQGAREE